MLIVINKNCIQIFHVLQVFQRRKDGSVDFYRTWNDYKNGFPDTAAGELWLGNEKLYYLTNQGNYKMRIDLVNRDGVSYNLNYDEFRIGNEGSNYELETLGGFTGDTGEYNNKTKEKLKD